MLGLSIDEIIRLRATAAADELVQAAEERLKHSVSEVQKCIDVHDRKVKCLCDRAATCDDDKAKLRKQQQATDTLVAKTEKRVESLESDAKADRESLALRFEACQEHFLQLKTDVEASCQASSKAIVPLSSAVAKLDGDVSAKLELFTGELDAMKDEVAKYRAAEASRHGQLLETLLKRIWADFRDFIKDAVRCEAKMLNGETGGAAFSHADRQAAQTLLVLETGASAPQAGHKALEHGPSSSHEACMQAITALTARCDELAARTSEIDAAKIAENTADIQALSTRFDEHRDDTVAKLSEELVVLQAKQTLRDSVVGRTREDLQNLRSDVDKGQDFLEEKLQVIEERQKVIETKCDAAVSVPTQPVLGDAEPARMSDIVNACAQERESARAQIGALTAQIIELRANGDDWVKTARDGTTQLTALEQRLHALEKRIRRRTCAEDPAGNVPAPAASTSGHTHLSERSSGDDDGDDDNELSVRPRKSIRKRAAPARFRDTEEPAPELFTETAHRKTQPSGRKRKRPAVGDSEYEPDESASSGSKSDDDAEQRPARDEIGRFVGGQNREQRPSSPLRIALPLSRRHTQIRRKNRRPSCLRLAPSRSIEPGPQPAETAESSRSSARFKSACAVPAMRHAQATADEAPNRVPPAQRVPAPGSSYSSSPIVITDDSSDGE